jgi:hypothetical protein
MTAYTGTDMPSVELTIKTLNLMLEYLDKRPWGEVNSIINAVHDELRPQLPRKQVEKPDEAIGGTD